MDDYTLHILADCEGTNYTNLERAVSKIEMWLDLSYSFAPHGKMLLTIKPREDEKNIWKGRSALEFNKYACTIVMSNLIKYNHS